jgi:uncharacterized membrane protein YdfJ with MMPL/SSD domain
MDSIFVAAPPRGALPVMGAWLAVLLAASVLALRVGDVVRGGSDAVPGSESIEAVDRAVAAGVPAGTFYPFVAVLAYGIATTGGTITSAAAIMISLFFAFGFTQLIATREFGLGLAFAVALDATIVRLVLLPALMALFGRANWWLPAFGSRPAGELA